ATNATYQDRIAAFGPRLTDEGLFGYLVSIETIEDDNQKGCNKLKKKFANDSCIALVERGQCSFIDKVRNMQASGAIAVVVGDNEHNGLITMYATVFVAQTEYRDLKSLLVVAKEPVEIQLLKDDLLQWPLLDVIIVVILSLTVLVIFIYVLWRIRQRQRRKRNLAPPQFVGDLPTKIFYRSKRQENEPQECVICLEDFVDEDELRIIPCFHEFHIKCIDSWLTTRHRFCPICKRDVTLPTTETPLLSVP
ncbi:27911_t:CDS:2, partial [Gigaspora margarita]